MIRAVAPAQNHNKRCATINRVQINHVDSGAGRFIHPCPEMSRAHQVDYRGTIANILYKAYSMKVHY